ncbi:ribonucleotide-diphosphate reductase subunit beta [Campylobacter coli]
MAKTYKKMKLFNIESKEKYNDAKVIGGDPIGIYNFNSTNHQWATRLYKLMQQRTWFPESINVAKDIANYSTLTAEEKRAYDLVLAQLITNDSYQTEQLATTIDPYITSPNVKMALFLQMRDELTHCLTEGTEILTDKGFVDFRYLTYEHKVANYCPDGSIYFKKPKDIIASRYNGPIDVYYNNTNFSMSVTPNHRVVTRYPNNNKHPEYLKGTLRIKQSKELTSISNFDVPIAGYNSGYNHDFSVIDALAIAFQADGTRANGQHEATVNGYSYNFYFKRNDKINRMRMLLKIGNVKHTETHVTSGHTVFYIWVPRYFDKTFDWVTLEDKHPVWFMMFLEELKFWDGSIRYNNIEYGYSIIYTNTNKRAIDKVTAIAALCGMQTGVYTIYPNENTNNHMLVYQLHIAPNKDHKSGRTIMKKSIQYDGNIYCCTCDTGMIIVRQGNSVFVTGNSEAYSRMALDICRDSDRIYYMHQEDIELMLKNKAVANMYANLHNGKEEKSVEDILMIAVANQILEELVFPGGFAVLFSLAKKMPGTAEMIEDINRDESHSHVPLFKHIYRTIIKEECNGIVPESVKKQAMDLILKMQDAEIRWTKYASQGLFGFTDEAIEIFIKAKVNNICRNLWLEQPYDKKDLQINPLQELVDEHTPINNTARQNFFENKVTEYNVAGIKDDWE